MYILSSQGVNRGRELFFDVVWKGDLIAEIRYALLKRSRRRECKKSKMYWLGVFVLEYSRPFVERATERHSYSVSWILCEFWSGSLQINGDDFADPGISSSSLSNSCFKAPVFLRGPLRHAPTSSRGIQDQLACLLDLMLGHDEIVQTYQLCNKVHASSGCTCTHDEGYYTQIQNQNFCPGCALQHTQVSSICAQLPWHKSCQLQHYVVGLVGLCGNLPTGCGMRLSLWYASRGHLLSDLPVD